MGTSPQKNGIACQVAMRELQPDDFNVESLRCLGISDREMRFVKVHVTSLHALYQRAVHYSSVWRSCYSCWPWPRWHCG